MRTRKEIENIMQKPTNGSLGDKDRQNLAIELLLDIRDALTNVKEQP